MAAERSDADSGICRGSICYIDLRRRLLRISAIAAESLTIRICPFGAAYRCEQIILTPVEDFDNRIPDTPILDTQYVVVVVRHSGCPVREPRAASRRRVRDVFNARDWSETRVAKPVSRLLP
jgi:hypothetical protein